MAQFTPYNPESSSLQTGDEGDLKSEDKEKPSPLGWGYTGFTVSPVHPLEVDAIKLSHPSGEVSLEGLDDEMVMVIHEAIGMADPVKSLCDGI